MNKLKILVVSPQSFEVVNRQVYRLLAIQFNLELILVIPSFVKIGNITKTYVPSVDEPFKVVALKTVGSHPRLMKFNGLTKLILEEMPTHIIAEVDPGTIILKEIVKLKRKIKFKLLSISLENIYRNHLYEAIKNLFYGKIKNSVGRFITWRLFKINTNNIDTIFCISNDAVNIMKKIGYKGCLIKIPLGIDTNLFHNQSVERIKKKRNELGLKKFTIAYFGRMVYEKGIENLLCALENIEKNNWQLMLNEFSDYENDYQKKIKNIISKYGFEDRIVYFSGTHREMPDYMNVADAIVLPSITTSTFKEQYGRVIAEAMACSKIVICSDSGTPKELLGDAGYVYKENNINELKNIILEILSSNQDRLDSIRDKAKRRAIAELSAMRQAEIMHEKIINN